MPDSIKWPVILVCPSEEELSLLAELSARRDTKIVAIADPNANSMGASLAEIMGIPVISNLVELKNLPGPEARYLIHPPCDDIVSEFLDDADDLGLTTIPAADFPAYSARHGAGPVAFEIATENVEDSEFLEMETAAIHRTLSRIEEAMDREGLLRWLLGLATRATGATSGSVMLFDKTTSELYLAFAYGLSETVMHHTRVKLGEDIAGRVAASGQAELVTGTKNPGAPRDRATIQAAICAPIHWEGTLLGVLNVSAADGENTLQANSLTKIKSLTHRFGMILDRFLNLQAIRDGELFRELEQTLSMDTGHPSNSGTTLALWAEDLADAAGASRVTLEVIAGTDLFVADREGFRYESPISTDKAEVLQTGRPLVARAKTPSTGLYETGTTIFLLPIGLEPVKALMTVEFNSASRAHHFNSISSEILFLVNRHISSFLDRVETSDQVDRLTTMATVVASIASEKLNDPKLVRDRILNTACTLTGASNAFLMEDTRNSFSGSLNSNKSMVLTPDLLAQSDVFLKQAQKHGWLTTILSTDPKEGQEPAERSIMVAPLNPEQPFPGLILVDKNRLHPLDSNHFTEFDALFARRLLPFLDLPAAPEPEIVEPPKIEKSEPAKTTCCEPGKPIDPQTPMVNILHREMDRCDRYHLMLGISAYRISPDKHHKLDIASIVAHIAQIMRTSDFVTCLEDGTILVLVPEDVRSLPLLKKRIVAHIREVTGYPDLTIASAARTYPGAGDSPENLLETLLAMLG